MNEANSQGTGTGSGGGNSGGNNGGNSGGPGSVAATALDKAANVAHGAVDKAVGAAAPAAHWIDQKTLAQQERYDATAEYVKQNPGRALAIAFVAGLLIGKVLL